MKIGNKYQVRTDNLNIIVSKKKLRTSKEGKRYEDWEDIAYFANFANALQFLLEQEVKNTGFKDLNTVVKRIEQVERMIDIALKTSESHTEASNHKSIREISGGEK